MHDKKFFARIRRTEHERDLLKWHATREHKKTLSFALQQLNEAAVHLFQSIVKEFDYILNAIDHATNILFAGVEWWIDEGLPMFAPWFFTYIFGVACGYAWHYFAING